MPTLADRLVKIMAQKGLKAADITRATGIKPPVISRYISGKVRPSSDNLLVISQYLDVTPDWLLSSLEAPEPHQIVDSIKTTNKDKVIEIQDKLIAAQAQIAEKDRQITELTNSSDALAEEVVRLGKPNEAQKELVEVIDTQKAQLEKLMGYCEGLVEEVQKLKTRLGKTN